MKYVQAIIALGLFGWLSYAVFTDTFPSGENGSSKTRALKGFISSTTEQFGVTQTAIGLAVIGVLLAAFFLMHATLTRVRAYKRAQTPTAAYNNGRSTEPG